MWHVSSDESISSGEEPIAIIVNAKVYEIEEDDMYLVNDYLSSKFNLVLINWDELALGDFNLKSDIQQKKSSEDYLIVDHDKLNPRIITGGKLKNDYFLGMKRRNSGELSKEEEQENNRPVKKINNKKGSKNNFNNNKKFREDVHSPDIQNGKDTLNGDRESKTKEFKKSSNNNLKSSKNLNIKTKKIQNSKELKKEESLAKKYEYLLNNVNNQADSLNPQENKYDFISGHINAIQEKMRNEFLSNNDLPPETIKLFDLFYDFNKKINHQIHCEVYDSLLNLVYIKTERSKERKNCRKIRELTDDIRIEYAHKIKNLSLPQIKKMQNYLPEKIWSGGNMSFRLDDIPTRKLPAFIHFVDNCSEMNSKNRDHINWMEALVKIILNFLFF
jgi:hypothetical protein